MWERMDTTHDRCKTGQMQLNVGEDGCRTGGTAGQGVSRASGHCMGRQDRREAGHAVGMQDRMGSYVRKSSRKKEGR